MKLLFTVLLVLLLEPAAAAAASPTMDHAMPALLDPIYPNPEDMFNPLCHYCAIPFLQCIHSMSEAPYIAAQMLYNEPQPYPSPLPDVNQVAPDLAPIFAYVAEIHQPPLMNEHVCNINSNQITIQPATVQAHIEDTYTPGDRLDHLETKSQKASHNRRQIPRRGGYPCSRDGCGRTFDRACELNRHRKTHLMSSERPHLCKLCDEGFLYPKDLVRHQRKHVDQPSAQVTFFCHYPGCRDLNGFSRRDNLLRHQRKKHPSIVMVA